MENGFPKWFSPSCFNTVSDDVFMIHRTGDSPVRVAFLRCQPRSCHPPFRAYLGEPDAQERWRIFLSLEVGPIIMYFSELEP